MTVKIVQKENVEPQPLSDSELVRQRMIAIINGEAKATPSAQIQAARVLLDCGQEDPFAGETVTSMFTALQEVAISLRSDSKNKRANREATLLDAIQVAPKGLNRPTAAELLGCSQSTAYACFKRLQAAGRASVTGKGKATRWVSVDR